MTGWPVPAQYEATVPYGKRGLMWGCDRDASGKGVHTGIDIACPVGTPLIATIAGTVRHRNYGSAFGNHQFAISPSTGQPFADGEVFYAHGSDRVPDGTEVQVGDVVGKSGAEGNVTGPHVHYEFHPHNKKVWNCGVHADPAPTLKASDGPYVVKDVYRSKCGFGEPTNGDTSSDTVKELQERLNRVSLKGGQRLPVTGRYDAETDEEVRLWQEQICKDPPDPPLASFLGPAQFTRMFPTPTYTPHDDGPPAISDGAPGTGTTLGGWLAARGWVVHDQGVPVGRDSTWLGVKYLILHHTGPYSSAAGMAKYLRSGTDIAPLAQLMLDELGEVWVCSRERGGQTSPGRASHAGLGSGFGVPDDQMNECSLGLEVLADGSKPLSAYPTQYAAVIRLLADLREYYRVPQARLIGHKEWSRTGKVDPLDDMDKVRADVEALLSPPPVDPPEPPIEPPGVVADDVLIWHDYTGEPTTRQVIKPGDWVLLDIPPLKKVPASGHEDHMVYARLNFTWKPLPTVKSFDEAMRTIANYAGKVEIKFVRGDGDATAYDERHYSYGTKSIPFQQVHWETGEKGLAGKWYMKFHGGLASVEVDTRYAKTGVIAKVKR